MNRGRLASSFGLPFRDLRRCDEEQLYQRLGQAGDILGLVKRYVSEEVRVGPGVAVETDVIHPLTNRPCQASVSDHLLDLVLEVAFLAGLRRSRQSADTRP